jgi:ribosomal protein L34E
MIAFVIKSFRDSICDTILGVLKFTTKQRAIKKIDKKSKRRPRIYGGSKCSLHMYILML